MLKTFLNSITHIYLACGYVDFRKQIPGLSGLVSLQFQLDPYKDDCAFIFCNKRRTSLRVLRYDRNGFVLASKTLLDDMKFQWPAKSSEVKEITPQQVSWLLDGLNIEQKKAHHDVRLNAEETCF